MGNSVSRSDSIVLVDAAAAAGLAHTPYMGHPQGTTGGVLPGADVLPRDENGGVVVVGMGVVAGIQRHLPPAELLQGVVGVGGDVQARFRELVVQQDDFDDDHLDAVADAGVQVEGGHLQVLVMG